MPHVCNYVPDDDPIKRLRALQTPERAAKAAAISPAMRAYLSLDRDKRIDREILHMIDACIMAHDAMEGGGAGRLVEGRLLVVVGPSGTGKTRGLRQAFSRREEFAGYADRHATSLLRSVVAPSPGISRQLAKTISTEIGYENLRDPKENVAWEMVHRQLPLRGVKFLHMDEVQHLVQNPNPMELQKIRDTLKRLVQNPRWPVWLILSGLQEVADFVEGDTQLRRRARFLKLEPLSLRKDVGVVRGMIEAYCFKAQLQPQGLLRGDGDTTDEFVARLLHASLGQAGTTIEFIQDAAMGAINDGSHLMTSKHFEEAFHARTGCAPSANVFKVENWAGVAVQKLLYPPAAEPIEEPKRRSRGPRNERDK